MNNIPENCKHLIPGRKYRYESGSYQSRPTLFVGFSPSGDRIWWKNGCATVDNSNPCCYKEYKEPKTGEFWLNIYPGGDYNRYPSKGVADNCAGVSRIACIRVKWTEGEGLGAETEKE